MWNQLSLKTKLLVLSGASCAFLLAVGIGGIIAKNRVVDEYKKITGSAVPNILLMSEMSDNFRNIRIELRNLAIQGLPEDQRKAALEKAKSHIAAYEVADKKYRDLPFIEGEQEKYDAMTKEWEAFKVIGGKVAEAAFATDAGAYARMSKLLTVDCHEAAGRYNAALAAGLEFQKVAVEKREEYANTINAQAGPIMLGLVALFAALLLGFGFVFQRALTRVLTAISQQLSDDSAAVATASTQIANASAQIASAASEQAAALQETVSSVEEISAMVQKNADNAKRSLTVSKSSHEAANRGKDTVESVIRSIQEIDRANADMGEQIAKSNQEIGDIVKVIREIGNKTKVINDIVFQTKLLSFNASVEAARAGEHGKGFAVVAEEVGNLAQMSGNAAKEISDMLDASIRKVEGIVEDTRKRVDTLVANGQEKVRAGTTTAQRCGEVLNEVVQNVGEVNQMVTEIATASDEQSRGVGEISKAMAQLDQVTQQNAAASQQATQAIDSLNVQAESMRDVVNRLVATVTGGAQLVEATPRSRSSGPSSGGASKVVPISSAKPKKAAVPEQSVQAVIPHARRKVAGGGEVPSSDDPRFETI